VAAFVAVAGWWTVDEPWDTLMPWIETPVDLERVRARAGRVTVVLSDNDPFTSDHVRNADAWSRRLGATVAMAPGRAHMNEQQEPEVLSAILAAIERTLEAPATAGNPHHGEEQP
jgi:predicted alpha/beta hydrolase family esterase